MGIIIIIMVIVSNMIIYLSFNIVVIIIIIIIINIIIFTSSPSLPPSPSPSLSSPTRPSSSSSSPPLQLPLSSPPSPSQSPPSSSPHLPALPLVDALEVPPEDGKRMAIRKMYSRTCAILMRRTIRSRKKTLLLTGCGGCDVVGVLCGRCGDVIWRYEPAVVMLVLLLQGCSGDVGVVLVVLAEVLGEE
jgi:hypothetical protein